MNPRDIWAPDVDVEQVQEIGRRWPILVVHMFETNQIGERRWIDDEIVDLNEREVRDGS